MGAVEKDLAEAERARVRVEELIEHAERHIADLRATRHGIIETFVKKHGTGPFTRDGEVIVFMRGKGNIWHRRSKKEAADARHGD